MKTNHWSMKVSRTFGRAWRAHDGWEEVTVCTPLGLVEVYRQWDDPHTSISAVIDGRLYQRGVNHCYSRRGCVTLAARFIAELSKGPQ